MRRLSKLNVIVFVMIVAAAISASAKQGEIQKAASVGQTVRGDLTIELESDLRNNSLQGHFAGAEKRAESKDDPGQKLAQLKPSPRQTQQIIHPLLNRLEPELQQLFKRPSLLKAPKLPGAPLERGAAAAAGRPLLGRRECSAEGGSRERRGGEGRSAAACCRRRDAPAGVWNVGGRRNNFGLFLCPVAAKARCGGPPNDRLDVDCGRRCGNRR